VPPTPPDAITFYWRPGCGFCMGLERRLDRLGVPLDKRNIWDDPDAARTVRSITGGNETVPTVVVGEARLVNPRVDAVLAAIRAEAPHLEPDEVPEQPSLLRRVIGG
jgi:mycoredoxin